MKIFNKYRGTRGFVVAAERGIRWRYMITQTAIRRTEILSFWSKHGLAATLDGFKIKRRALFNWKRRLKDGRGKLEALNPKSRAPKVRRRRSWPPRVIEEITRLRAEHPNLGKDKIHPLLKEFCDQSKLLCPRPRTIGRLIKDLGGLRLFPRKITGTGRVVKVNRQKITRKPNNFKAEYPGHCIGLDTIEEIVHGSRRYVITCEDLFGRFAFAWATNSHGSKAAAEFFTAFRLLFPYPVTFVLTDNGSEWKKHFAEALLKLQITHYHTYPKTPKMNAHIERFNRTIQEEFLNYHKGLLLDLDRFNTKLMDWLIWYNTKRVHYAFGNRLTPAQFLLSWKPMEDEGSRLPVECKNGWPHTIGCRSGVFCYTDLYHIMPEFAPTIGLEIHAELKTKTKMFCRSANDPNETEPNVNVCPICLGHPGALPTINQKAVEHVLRVGLAVGGQRAEETKFDRKNYFYPDLPKGYQISQYKYPLVVGGSLNSIALTRIHLEEDTARSIHDNEGGGSLIDFNRAGIPLMELVTEPVITGAKRASEFAHEFQLLLRYLDVSEANMEKGEMRVEANISILRIDADIENADSRGLLYEELSYKIRGAAFNVYNALGSGHKEAIYQNALAEELKKTQLPFEKEKHIAVSYENHKVGSYQPDFLVSEKIIVEIKALPFLGKPAKEQVLYYLKNSPYRLALLINFGAAPLQIERIVFDSIRENPLSCPRQSATLGTKVEVKNLNSFRAVERAIDYEIKRQIGVLEAGEKVIQETRGWDENKGETFSQRQKESAHDYRYFPEPDLPKLRISEIKAFDNLKNTIPELPWQKRERYTKDYELKMEEIEQYVTNLELGKFFEMVAGQLVGVKDSVKLASNYITNDLVKLIASGSRTAGLEVRLPNTEHFAELIKMIAAGEVSSRGAKDILPLMMNNHRSPKEIAIEKGLTQKNDLGELEKIVAQIITDNPKVAADFKAGKQAALQFLIGQGMKLSQGAANPKTLEQLFVGFLKQKC